MKTVQLTAKFPDVPEVENSIVEQASASTLRAAVSRALAAILKNPSLKRKRIRQASFDLEVKN